MRDQPVKRAKKGLRKYKSIVGKLRNRVSDKVVNPKVVKSRATVVMSLVKVSRPSELVPGDGATLVWCLIGTKRQEFEATIETEARQQHLELLGALKSLIAKDDSAIAWAKRKDAGCFVKFVVDLIPTPVFEECVKAIRQRTTKREKILLRTLLELFQDMPVRIPAKELNDLDSYGRL